MYCEFENTNKIFNGKKIYKCKNCGLNIALENPSINMICFKNSTDLFNKFSAGTDVKISPDAEFLESDQDARTYIKEKLSKELGVDSTKISENQDQLCTDEQINQRLDICNKCNYYQNNACMLCGCTVVREKNYMNKLANKQAKCPDNRWGPVN